MTRDASSWSGSTVGPRASAAPAAAVPRSLVTVGTTRRPAAPAALPLHGLRHALRRPDRHRPGRPAPAAPALGAVPVPDGPEPPQPADRPGAGPRRLRRAGD